MKKHERKISSPSLLRQISFDLKKQSDLEEVKKLCLSTIDLIEFYSADIKLLSEVVKTARNLTKLTIGWVKGRVDNWFSLVTDALKNNHSLKTLNLSGNQIDDEVVKSLSEVLKTNTILIELNLKNNLIGEDGTIELLDLLKTNTTLKILNIDTNQIGDNVIKELSNQLTRNTSLKSISLKSNGINDNGALQISQMLKLNNGLNSINLEDNRLITENSYKAIVEVGLYNNYFLTSLSFKPFSSNHKINIYKDQLIDRNISLIEKFAHYLVSSKPLNLSLESLNYFKHCEKGLLLKYLKNDEAFLQELVEEYLDPKFYQKNFFKLAGICKSFESNQPKKEGETNIQSLPKVLIEKILSFIPIEDYRLDFSGDSNDYLETEI